VLDETNCLPTPSCDEIMQHTATFLCPVDFSPPSDRALAYARDLAAALGARLHVVHVNELPFYALASGASALGPAFAIRAESEIHREITKRAESVEGVQTTTEVVEGTPHEEIVRLAAEHAATLIVMGTHGRRGVARVLIGSVAERVVRTSIVPVLTVPAVE
jgi:nucleotide-binding universal stress UspA family protein